MISNETQGAIKLSLKTNHYQTLFCFKKKNQETKIEQMLGRITVNSLYPFVNIIFRCFNSQIINGGY